MSVNIQNLIDRLRNESPLIGRNARQYIADILQTMFDAHISHFGTSDTAANVANKIVTDLDPGTDTFTRGARVVLYFTHGNMAPNPTLTFFHIGTFPIIQTSNWAPLAFVEFIFDGTAFRQVSSRKAPVTDPVVDTEGEAIIGTDNGEYATADHSHILYVDHHTEHTTRGRFIQDRMPTSEEDERILAVNEAGTSPRYQQINHHMLGDDSVRTNHILDRNVTTEKIAHRAVTGYELMTSETPNRVLAVEEAGTDPAFVQVTDPMIADDAVRTHHILDQNVTAEKIADDAVRTHHILDQNVTTPKIADRNVTTEKIAHRAVTGYELMTSETDNMVLRVGEAGTDPYYDKVQLETDLAGRIPFHHLPTATEEDEFGILRINEAGSDPHWGKIRVPDDLEGVMPIVHGGTGADNAFDARANLGAAPASTVFGPINVHQNSPWIIDFGVDKRLTLSATGTSLASNGVLRAIDTVGGVVSAWSVQRRATGSSNRSNDHGINQATINASIGWKGTGQRAGFTDVELFFHRDRSLYTIQIVSWANSAATATDAPATRYLENAMFIIREITSPETRGEFSHNRVVPSDVPVETEV